MENTPDYIFDWIESTPFESLSAAQKEEVLLYLPQTEYQQLHQAAALATQYTQQGSETFAQNNATLGQLHALFDAKHTPPQITTKPEKRKGLAAIWMWKAAASILLIAVAFLSYGLYNAKQHQNQSGLIEKIDTVFVNITKEIPREVKIHDTVYLTRPSQNNAPARIHPYTKITPPQSDISPNINPLRSVPLTEKDQPQNTPKNNSIKDDTLVQNFNFVTL